MEVHSALPNDALYCFLSHLPAIGVVGAVYLFIKHYMGDVVGRCPALLDGGSPLIGPQGKLICRVVRVAQQVGNQCNNTG